MQLTATHCSGACDGCAAPSACAGVSDDPQDCLDDLVCYKTKTSKGQTKFTPVVAFSLTEDFPGTADVVKAKTLCLPADAGDGVLDATTHREDYQVKNTAGAFRFEDIEDRFGTRTLFAGKPDRLLVPTNKGLGTTPPSPSPGTADLYKCFSAKFSKTTPFPKGVQLIVEDQFQDRLYDVKKLKRICYPATSSGERFVNPVAVMMCYQIKPAKEQPKHSRIVDQLQLHNRFGIEHVDTIKEDVLCVPAKRL